MEWNQVLGDPFSVVGHQGYKLTNASVAKLCQRYFTDLTGGTFMTEMTEDGSHETVLNQ